jgi:hypothetical protein
MEPRRVSQRGTIHYGKHSLFISTALPGWSVGLEPCEQTKFNIHFGQLLLGQYDESTASFQRSNAPTYSTSKGIGMSHGSPKPPCGAPKTGPRRTT